MFIPCLLANTCFNLHRRTMRTSARLVLKTASTSPTVNPASATRYVRLVVSLHPRSDTSSRSGWASLERLPDVIREYVERLQLQGRLRCPLQRGQAPIIKGSGAH